MRDLQRHRAMEDPVSRFPDGAIGADTQAVQQFKLTNDTPTRRRGVRGQAVVHQGEPALAMRAADPLTDALARQVDQLMAVWTPSLKRGFVCHIVLVAGGRTRDRFVRTLDGSAHRRFRTCAGIEHDVNATLFYPGRGRWSRLCRRIVWCRERPPQFVRQRLAAGTASNVRRDGIRGRSRPVSPGKFDQLVERGATILPSISSRINHQSLPCNRLLLYPIPASDAHCPPRRSRGSRRQQVSANSILGSDRRKTPARTESRCRKPATRGVRGVSTSNVELSGLTLFPG